MTTQYSFCSNDLYSFNRLCSYNLMAGKNVYKIKYNKAEKQCGCYSWIRPFGSVVGIEAAKTQIKVFTLQAVNASSDDEAIALITPVPVTQQTCIKISDSQVQVQVHSSQIRVHTLKLQTKSKSSQKRTQVQVRIRAPSDCDTQTDTHNVSRQYMSELLLITTQNTQRDRSRWWALLITEPEVEIWRSWWLRTRPWAVSMRPQCDIFNQSINQSIHL